MGGACSSEASKRSNSSSNSDAGDRSHSSEESYSSSSSLYSCCSEHHGREERDYIMELISSLMAANVEIDQLVEVVETFLKLLKQIQRLRVGRPHSTSGSREVSTVVHSLSSSFAWMSTPPNSGFAPKRPNKFKRVNPYFSKFVSEAPFAIYENKDKSPQAAKSDATMNDSAYLHFDWNSNLRPQPMEPFSESVYISSSDEDAAAEGEEWGVSVYLPSDEEERGSSVYLPSDEEKWGASVYLSSDEDHYEYNFYDDDVDIFQIPVYPVSSWFEPASMKEVESQSQPQSQWQLQSHWQSEQPKEDEKKEPVVRSLSAEDASSKSKDKKDTFSRSA